MAEESVYFDSRKEKFKAFSMLEDIVANMKFGISILAAGYC